MTPCLLAAQRLFLRAQLHGSQVSGKVTGESSCTRGSGAGRPGTHPRAAISHRRLRKWMDPPDDVSLAIGQCSLHSPKAEFG